MKILDCTLRDGGYVNNHSFSKPQALNIINCLLSAGVDLIEVGYFKRKGKINNLGPSGYCPDDYLDSLPKNAASKLALMIRPGSVSPKDVVALRGSAITHVRIPASIQTMALSIDLVAAAREIGMKVFINFIRTSELQPEELYQMLDYFTLEQPYAFYFADSNGALFPEHVHSLVKHVKQNYSFSIGFHAHDSLGFANGNSWIAYQAGATWLDSTIGGLGKGGGNTQTEVLLPLASLLDKRKVKLYKLLDATNALPPGLLLPRMAVKLKNAVYGMYNLNIDEIAKLERESILPNIDVDLIEKLKSFPIKAVNPALFFKGGGLYEHVC